MKKIHEIAIAFICGILLFASIQVQAVVAAEAELIQQGPERCLYLFNPPQGEILVTYENNNDFCLYKSEIGQCAEETALPPQSVTSKIYAGCGPIFSAEFTYGPDCGCPKVNLR
ncbi:MAG: hypothetical protein F6J93_02375 [Oscillatoria sp. SIO1A7]|nr:hypothetical protein [Oscillatoria sp. SIO1A7]